MCKILMLAVFLISTPAFAGEHAPRFGITVISSAERACATFEGTELNLGQKIVIAAFNPPRWLKGKITEKKPERCETRDVLEGAAYEVQLERNNTLFFETGVAVVAGEAKLVVKSGRPVLFTNANRQSVIIHKCTSYEGVHLSAWEGSSRLWHDYYTLSYDVDPTCSREESED